MIGFLRSFIPARPAAPQSTVPLAPAQDSPPASVAADSTRTVVGTRLNFRRSSSAGRESNATVFSSLSL